MANKTIKQTSLRVAIKNSYKLGIVPMPLILIKVRYFELNV